jgi:hypothetical protein
MRVMLFEKLLIKSGLGNFPDTVMIGLDLLGTFRLASSDQACGTELLDFRMTATADPGGALGDLQVNRLSGYGDHFQQPPRR